MKSIITTIEKIGQSLEIGDFTFNSDGYLSVILHEQHTVHFQLNESQNTLNLYAEIADLTHIKSVNLLSELLKENYFSQEKNHFHFSINPETNWLLLFKSIDEPMIDPSILKSLIDNLLEAIIYWQKHINNFLQDNLNKKMQQNKYQIPANKFSFISR
ncbi:type III secretion system chaperone [uncultured Shewanella sp.]|uniref:type III secretion system chaperone n=1 Tax=uncultured Shewanella sp. TaxID=173975 RepID=UPI00262FCB4B|nr:type III secretion system chaperone [uncultured Shewanella sp.]